MDLNISVGDRVVLVDKFSQVFEGVINSINEKLQRLTIKNVVLQPNNISLEGERPFHRSEIVEFKKVSDTELNSADEKSSEKNPNDVIVCEKLEESKYSFLEKLQSEYRYIKDFGTNFHSAISILKECTIIGLCAKDVSKGRLERASLIAISTNSNVFIFDIQILGDDLFFKGLKEVLESPNVIKVVHDCRFLSDCLFHKHTVRLQNVRDVEAEDIILVHQNRKTIRNHTRSLDYLVKVYLKVEFNCLNVALETWKERPLPQEILKFLASFVSYLIPIQEVIEKVYLERLINASDIYNKFIRDSDIFDVVQTEAKNTLKREMIELVKPKISPRFGDFKLPKNY